MSDQVTLDSSETIADSVNAVFAGIEEGFVNRHNEPAMTTPTVLALTEVVVVGSTICLIC
jgi:hypothetical protein